MIQKLRFAALLACVLLFGAGCASGPRTFGGDRNIPEPHVDPGRIRDLSELLPNLRVVSINCSYSAPSVRITGTVVNDGGVPAGAFFFEGTAVSGPDTTQLPEGVNNRVTAGLPAHSASQDVFLAQIPLNGPQGWNITFVVDPPDAQNAGGEIREFNENDNRLSAICACENDPRGPGYRCSVGGGGP